MGNPVEALLAPKFHYIGSDKSKPTPQKEKSPLRKVPFKHYQKYSLEYVLSLEAKEKRVNSFSNKVKQFFGFGETLTEKEQEILAKGHKYTVSQLMPEDSNKPE